jgi:hypothetical protein
MAASAHDLARWTRFAAKGGIGRCTATVDCVASQIGDLMFLKVCVCYQFEDCFLSLAVCLLAASLGIQFQSAKVILPRHVLTYSRWGHYWQPWCPAHDFTFTFLESGFVKELPSSIIATF